MPALALAPTSTSDLQLAVHQAVEILARCASVDEVLGVLDQGRALAAYVSSRKAGQAAENHAIEIVIRAERRIGELLDTLPTTPPAERRSVRTRNGALLGESTTTPTRTEALASIGLSAMEASRCRKLAEVPEATFTAHVAAVTARAEKLTRSGTIAAVSHADAYDSNDWGTPPDHVEAVRRVLGEIDLDPASSDRAQRIVRAHRHYTVADDGLARTWKGRVFCNPPYSQPLCARFVAKFVDEVQSGRVTKGIILLNASTDTAWWHDLASRYDACFTRGRMAFLRPDGAAAEGNRVGQVYFAAGCGREFHTVFASIGLVMRAV